MKVYLAGPMRGYPFYNFAEFDRVAAIIEELGHTPVSPADISRDSVRREGFDPDIESAYTLPRFTPEGFMEEDILAMRDAECLVLLSGWSNSKGAAVELAYARYRDIPIYSCIDEFEYAVCRKQAA